MRRYRFPEGTQLFTINEEIRYFCIPQKDGPQLSCMIPGGALIAIPIDDDIELETLLFLCDRMAFMMWGIHGQHGVSGIDLPDGIVGLAAEGTPGEVAP
jgi:hypothetical protein